MKYLALRQSNPPYNIQQQHCHIKHLVANIICKHMMKDINTFSCTQFVYKTSLYTITWCLAP